MASKYQLVVYSTETGQISSVTRDVSSPIDPTNLGPGFSYLKLFSPKPVDVMNWMVAEGRLVYKPIYFKTPERVDRIYSVAMVSDKEDEPTGFGGQVGILGKALKERRFAVEFHKYSDLSDVYNWNFNVMVSLSDLAQMMGILENPPASWIHWLPVSSKSISDLFWQRLQKVPFVVAMSQFGYQEILAHGYPADRLSMIPHGVDTRIFHPLMSAERKAVRTAAEVDGKYVMCFVGTNSPRKRLDLLLKVFKRVIEIVGGEKLLLLLKTGESGAYDLYAMLKEMDLLGKVQVQTENLDSEGMSSFYSMCDLYVTAAEAEGFGVPLIEAMACGLPIVAGDHTTSKEIVGQAGTLVPCGSEMQKLYGYDIERYPPEIEPMALAIVEHFNMAHRGMTIDRSLIRNHVVRNFSKEISIGLWEEFIQRVMNITGEMLKAPLRDKIFPENYVATASLSQESELLLV